MLKGLNSMKILCEISLNEQIVFINTENKNLYKHSDENNQTAKKEEIFNFSCFPTYLEISPILGGKQKKKQKLGRQFRNLIVYLLLK